MCKWGRFRLENADSSIVSESAESNNVTRSMALSALRENDDSAFNKNDNLTFKKNDSTKEEIRICKHCGETVPSGSVLCLKCGCFWSR